MCNKCNFQSDKINFLSKGFSFCPFCGKNLEFFGDEIIVDLYGDDDLSFIFGSFNYGTSCVEVFHSNDDALKFLSDLKVEPVEGKDYVYSWFYFHIEKAKRYLSFTQDNFQRKISRMKDLRDFIIEPYRFSIGGNQTITIFNRGIYDNS